VRALLLDTHAFLWFVYDDARISARATEMIEDGSTDKLLSVASLWEIVVKSQLGKLELGMSTEEFLEQRLPSWQLQILGIETRDLVAYSRLPLYHRDPFDRLIIAQGACRHVPVVTSNPSFSDYDIETCW